MFLFCIILITIQHSACMNEININDTTLTTSTVLIESDYSTTTELYEDVTTTETTIQEDNFDNAFKFNVINQSVTTDEIELNENSISDKEIKSQETKATTAECNITDMSLKLLDNNDYLHITWNVSDAKLCRDEKFRMTFKIANCEGSASVCEENTDFIPMYQNKFDISRKFQACLTYEVRASWKETEIFYTILRGHDFYEQVQNLKWVQFTETSIILSWTYDKFPNCVDNYEIILEGKSYKSIIKEKLLQDMKPCQNYNIIVRPKSDSLGNTNHYDKTIQVNMPEVHPTKVRDLKLIQIKNNAVEIDWIEPEFGEKCVFNYSIRVKTSGNVDNQILSTVPPKVTLTDVYSCVIYTISVTSITVNATLGFVTTDEILTIPIKPNPPESPESITLTDTTLKLYTEVKPSRNKCKLDEAEFNCEDMDNPTNQNPTKRIKFISTIVTNITGELTNLEPFTLYKCTARVSNEAGWSDNSSYHNYVTDQGIPERPKVTVLKESVTSTSFSFKWDPRKTKGPVKHFNIYIRFYEYRYYNPSVCNWRNLSDFEEKWSADKERQFTFIQAFPFTSYSIQITTVNTGDKVGEYSDAVYCDTNPSPSDEIRMFQYLQNQPVPTFEHNATVVFSWKYPCYANGDLSSFYGQCNAFDHTQELFMDINNKELSEFVIAKNLIPDNSYECTIYADSRDHLSGIPATIKVETKPGIPQLPLWSISNVTSEPSTTSAAIFLPSSFFNRTVGRIQNISLLVSEMDCQAAPKILTGIGPPEKSLSTWNEVQDDECMSQYVTKYLTENDFDAIMKKQASQNGIQYIIGNEACPSNDLYCNGPLKSGQKFAVVVRAFTNTGYSDSNYITIQTEKTVAIYTILISILSILIITFFIGLFISYRRAKIFKKKCCLTDNPIDAPEDVSLGNFPTYYESMTENENEKIAEEFKTINVIADGIAKTSIASKSNEKLNRYSNISPFDLNRVVLNEDEFENDYINASYIDGYNYSKEYIAAQGPKPNTCHDFWRMIIQHECEAIVMLTSLIEQDKVKCHEYFPKLNGTITFENIKILCSSEQVFSSYVKRVLAVEKDDVKLKVNHYYFTKWPDHDCPANSMDLIEFCKCIRSQRKKLLIPLIVHCSAGVGRTGTFIGLDIMMQRMKIEKKINIFDMVKQLRFQRMKTVQTIKQYAFLYQTALELSRKKRHPKVFEDMTLFMENCNYFKKFKKSTKPEVKESRTNFNNESTM